MPLLASDIMDDAAAYLNDTGKQLFTYTEQLPYLKLASQALEQELIINDMPVQLADTVILSIPADTTDLIAKLPSDLVVPIRLWERSLGATNDQFVPMDEVAELPNASESSNLGYWCFRNNTIKVIGATEGKDLRLEYWRTLSPISGQSSNAEVVLSRNFLAAKTAELCARYVGENPDRAGELFEEEVKPAFDRLMRIYNKNQQGNRARRRRFSMSRSLYTR